MRHFRWTTTYHRASSKRSAMSVRNTSDRFTWRATVSAAPSRQLPRRTFKSSHPARKGRETDFSEPGELGVLIDDAQVRALEAMMAAKGFLTGRQMAMTFQFLHARDLVWSSRTKSYLLGEPAFVNDLVTWNADVTRLPATMHGQYLRRMYLRNELAIGKYSFRGDPISLRDIHIPMFVVGTEKDHVSPWKSVYKIHQLVSCDVTFVLTNGDSVRAWSCRTAFQDAQHEIVAAQADAF